MSHSLAHQHAENAGRYHQPTDVRTSPPPSRTDADREGCIRPGTEVSQSSALSSVPRLAHARLVMCDGACYAALVDQGTHWVVPAAGCLLQPEIGDTVLISVSGVQGYILTVLQRAAGNRTATLRVPGNLHLSLPDGQLTVSASDGISLDAGPTLDMAAQTLSAALQFASVACSTMQVTGETSRSHWKTHTTISEHALDFTARHESHVCHSVYRVAGHAEISAQSLRHTIDQDWSVSADTTDLKARDRVTVQGDTVQLG